MPSLANPRHERFAQGLSKGESASKAYENAGYKPNRQAASRLLSNVDVQTRVKELQDVGATRAEMTFEGHLRKLEELRDQAIEDGNLNAAIQAEQLRGKAHGYYVDRHLVDATTRTVTGEPMKPEDWQSEYTSDARH